MKYITLIIGLLVVGCGETCPPPMPPEKTDTNESTPTTNTNKVDGTTEKPVKELTAEEKVVGTYEAKVDTRTFKGVFLENGKAESYKTVRRMVKELGKSLEMKFMSAVTKNRQQFSKLNPTVI